MLCRYRVRFTVPLSVFLALALSLSPVLSCYSYAEGSPEGQETENERSEERGAAGSGDEPREVAEKPEDDCEAGEGAAEGEAAPPSLPEVPSGAGPGFGGSAGPGVDGSPEDAYSSGGRDSESALSDELGSFDALHADQLDGSSVAVDSGSSDSESNSSGVAEEGLGTELPNDSRATTLAPIDALMAKAWSGSTSEWTIGNIKFKALNGTIFWLVSLLAFKVDAIYGESVRSNNYLKAIDTASKSSAESNSSVHAVLRSALYANNASGNPVSVAGYLSAMSPYMVTIQKALDQANAYTVADSSLLSKGLDDLRKALYANNQAGNSVSVAGYLSTMSPYMFTIDQKLGLLAQIRSDLEANNSSGTLLSVAQYLSTMSPILGSIDRSVSSLVSSVGFNGNIVKLLTGLQDSVTAWGTRWDKQDQWLIEWGKRWESLSPCFDLSGVVSRLDAIKNLLVAAGLIENGKDLLDVIFGDLSGIGQAAATGAIQSAMESAFPFCIPALVKQLFGLLAFEGSAPVWEFDICGNPLVCAFSGFQLVADCTSWLSRLGLVLALLVNTRKFVFTVNGGGAS